MAGSLTDYVAATNQYVTGPGAFDNDYDEAGNQERNKLGEVLAYDANNRQTSYTTGSATTTYHYGPSGNRVKKVTPAKTDIYVYDAFGKMAAEYSTVATTAPVGAHYRTVDHLGSARLVTLQDQSAFACYDYAPFGEEIPDTLGNRNLVTCYAGNLDDRQKFTGKERDSESDMDYFLARYYSGPMGRFLSVDPGGAGANPGLPQSWNAYAYVNNGPLTAIDPNGEEPVTAVTAGAVATHVVTGAATGFAVGATVDAGIQVVQILRGKQESFSTTRAFGSGVSGAVTGAVIGPAGGLGGGIRAAFTKAFGANAGGTIAGLSGLGVASGAAGRAAEGREDVLGSFPEVVTDVLLGPTEPFTAGAGNDLSTGAGNAVRREMGGVAEEALRRGERGMVGAAGSIGRSSGALGKVFGEGSVEALDKAVTQGINRFGELLFGKQKQQDEE
jgi:RHS repeat-associated protein